MPCLIESVKQEELSLWLHYRMIVIREVFSCSNEDLLQQLEQENRNYFLSSFTSHDFLGCFVRDESKEILGVGGLCFSRELPSPDNLSGKCAYLMNIYTLPAFRNQGIARKTVIWLIRQAVKLGCEKIYLESSETAKTLYLSLGFEEMKDYYKLNLQRFSLIKEATITDPA